MYFATDACHRRRGTPRGIVNAMATKRRSPVIYSDEVRGLMREIDLRINDCRGIVTDPIRVGLCVCVVVDLE
jgi:hypothetical protein